MMDITTIAVWSSTVLSVLAILGHLKTFFGSGEAANSKRLDGHEAKLIDHDRRIQSVESDIKHLPDRDATHRMELALSDMNGKFAALEEKLKPIAATSERLHELLMEQAKR